MNNKSPIDATAQVATTTTEVAVSPFNNYVASIHAATTTNTNTAVAISSSSMIQNDYMVLVVIQLVPNQLSSLENTTTNQQSITIRIPTMSSLLSTSTTTVSSSSSSSFITKIMNEKVSYTVRNRQLLWFHNSIPSRSSKSDQHQQQQHGDYTTTTEQYLGLITTIGPIHDPDDDNNDNDDTTESNTFTLLTVLDRTRGIPIYTILCNNPITTIPSILSSTTTTAITSTKEHPSNNNNNNKSESQTFVCQCIGIYSSPPPLSNKDAGNSNSSSNYYYYIAIQYSTNNDQQQQQHRRKSSSTADGTTKQKVVVYECSIATGKVNRKIKLSSGTDSMINNNKYNNRTIFYPPTISMTNNAQSTNSTLMLLYTIDQIHLRAMNILDGTKQYKTKLSIGLPSAVLDNNDNQIEDSPISSSSSYTTIVVASSIIITAVACTAINRIDSMDTPIRIQLYDTKTGVLLKENGIPSNTNQGKKDTPIADSTSQQSYITVQNMDDTIANNRNNVVQIQMIVTPTTLHDEHQNTKKSNSKNNMSKKTKKGKDDIGEHDIDAQKSYYNAWILINEVVLVQVMIHVNSSKNHENDINNANKQYTVIKQWKIENGSNDRIDVDSHQRCFLIRHPSDRNKAKHNSSLSVDTTPYLMVVQPQVRPIKVQTVPLLPNEDIMKTNTIKIRWETKDKHRSDDSRIPMDIDGDNPEEEDDRDMYTTAVDNELQADATTTTSTSSKKRKLTTVLGPGQAGGEARGVSETINSVSKQQQLARDDKDIDTKTEEDDIDEKSSDNEPTIAERLRLLQQALDDEEDDDYDNAGDVKNDDSPVAPVDNDDGGAMPKFVPKYATTESLTQLLVQGLQSSDGTMIEQAFQVRDKDIIRKTCMSLSSDQVLELLNVLVQRLANKPTRAEQLVAWVSAILLSNRITDIEHLQPLQNLLQERLEVFPMLLQLEGRLENMIGM